MLKLLIPLAVMNFSDVSKISVSNHEPEGRANVSQVAARSFCYGPGSTPYSSMISCCAR